MDKHLHIVTLDVPWPADFGGVMDLFYKIKSLHELGIKIHLHCFTNNRAQQPSLEKFCETVDYYPRHLSFSLANITLPYIVQSRISKKLIQELNKDNYPVLLEGIHCTYPLYKGLLKDKKVLVRLHNVEFNYYKKLCENEANLFKKLYFFIESKLLFLYEKKLAKNTTYLTVSKADNLIYQQLFSTENLHFIPVFTSWTTIKSTHGFGNYCLYHGNLSVNENIKAVEWLLEEVFSKCNFPFVIAGKNPSSNLKKLAHRFSHTCIVENPSDYEMDDLIRKAHINILPSFNNTGVKLKLIHALFNGKHCLTNTAAVEGSGLSALCCSAVHADDYIEHIKRLLETPFTENDIQNRNAVLMNLYNNSRNAEALSKLIY